MHRQILLRTYSVILFGITFLCCQTIASAVTVDDVEGLIAAVSNANDGGYPTILLSDGIYHLNSQYLRITADGVTVRSADGQRSAVIIDGDYETTEIFQRALNNCLPPLFYGFCRIFRKMCEFISTITAKKFAFSLIF